MTNYAGAEKLSEIVSDPRAVLFVHTASSARQILSLKKDGGKVVAKIIATSPHAYFVFDNAQCAYQSIEEFGCNPVEAIKSVRERCQPTSIGYFDDVLAGPQRNAIAELLRAENNQSVYGFMGTSDAQSVTAKRSGLRSWLLSRPRLYYLLKIKRTMGVTAFLRLFWYQLWAKPILLLNSGYCWDFAHTELYKRGYAIWGQINLGIPGEGVAERAVEWLKHKKFAAVVYSINATDESRQFSRVVKSMNIPMIGWQHGDVNYIPARQIAIDDLEFADVFLNWGVGAQENLQVAGERYGLPRRLKVVGSSYLDDLKKKYRAVKPAEKTPTIVYATTMYYLAGWIEINDLPWSDLRVYQNQREIIRALASLDGQKLVKFHPSARYHVQELFDYCNSFADKNVQSITSSSIRAIEAMSKGDVIIIDTPSTTLLEAVVLEKPIFCLTNQVKISDQALALLKKRAVVSDNPTQLMKLVADYLKTGAYPADINNDEFLEAFGTQAGGEASKRAAEVVADLLSKKA